MLTKKLATRIATASLIATTFAPVAFADTTIDVSGNGAGSTNGVTVVDTNTTAVEQTNNTTANTTVNATANTGGNQANNNTGGDVGIATGNATNDVTVTVAGGDNTAVLPDPCGCEPLNTTVTVGGNGANSNNTVTTVTSNTTLVGQTTKTKANTTINVKAKTGKNKANNNTGPGGVGITTGDASNTVGVSVTGGSNLFGSLLSLFGL